MNTKTQITLKSMVAAATLIAAAVTSAHADDVVQVHVNYADLNLRTAAGAAVLHHRISAAADQVCGIVGDRDIARRARVDGCKAMAMADALATVKVAEVRLAALK